MFINRYVGEEREVRGEVLDGVMLLMTHEENVVIEMKDGTLVVTV